MKNVRQRGGNAVGIMKVLYLDVLFLINFCLDYMSLHVAGALLHRKRQIWRLMAAALFGALYATAAVLYPGNQVVQAAIGIGVSVIMCLIVYGSARFFKVFLVLYVVSLLLGAMITVIYSTLHRYLSMEEVREGFSDQGTGLFFMAAAAGGVLIRLCGAWLSKAPAACHECRVTVCLFGRTVSFRALLDSGNLLTDPLSGRKAVVVGLQTVRGILPPSMLTMLATSPPDPTALPYGVARRVRLIPAEGVGGRRLLVGVIPDSLVLECADKKGGMRRIQVDAVLAIDTEGHTDYGGCEAVMPMSLAA